jgi:hypothetical protein
MAEIVVVCEHREDWELAAILLDRVLREKGPDWLAESSLDLHRRWCGIPVADPAVTFCTWSQLKKLPKPSKSLGYRRLGWDAEACRKAIIAAEAASRGHEILALLLVRDLDSEPKRRHVLEAVRTESTAPFEVLLATPNPEIEAWIFHGFVARDRDEEKRLEDLRRRLSFDPVTDSHLFKERSRSADRHIKKALAHLTDGQAGRRLSCMKDEPLELLHERGQQTYLSAYLTEVEQNFLPRIARNPRTRIAKRRTLD